MAGSGSPLGMEETLLTFDLLIKIGLLVNKLKA